MYYVFCMYWSEVKWKSLSHVWLFVTPWTLQPVGFSRPEYWSGEPLPSPGDLPNPGMEPRSAALQVDFLPAKIQGNSSVCTNYIAFHFFQGCGENSLFVDQGLTQLQSGVSGMKTSVILDFLVNISVTKIAGHEHLITFNP